MDTTVNYLHLDHLGSTSVISDSTGTQTETIRYFPFGATRSGSTSTDKKFTGQRLDATGLYYYGARYYDCIIGRFISADTVVQSPGNPQTLNRYSYVTNNPLKYTDPSGHVKWDGSEDLSLAKIENNVLIVDVTEFQDKKHMDAMGIKTVYEVQPLDKPNIDERMPVYVVEDEGKLDRRTLNILGEPWGVSLWPYGIIISETVPEVNLAQMIKHEIQHYTEQIQTGFDWYIGYGAEYSVGCIDYFGFDKDPYYYSMYEQRARIYSGEQQGFQDTDFGWSYLLFEKPLEIFIDFMSIFY